MEHFRYDASEYDRGRRDEDVAFWVREAIRIANLRFHPFILDLGCGTGNYAIGFREQTVAVVHGLDPSIEMMKVGRLKSSSGVIDWLRGVAETIPFRDETFDCIFSSQVWHHMQDKRRAAIECYGVLKSGAPLIIRTISHEQWREKTICRFFPEILPSQTRVYPSMMEFREYLGKAGFRRIDVLPYRLERYTYAEEFVEAAEKKLWSMFKHVPEESLKSGIEQLRKLGRQPIRNDELITLVVGWK